MYQLHYPYHSARIISLVLALYERAIDRLVQKLINRLLFQAKSQLRHLPERIMEGDLGLSCVMLSRVPREIRDQIYEYCMAREEPINPFDYERRRRAQIRLSYPVSKIADTGQQKCFSDLPSLALLSVNKQISEESRQVMFRLTTWHIPRASNRRCGFCKSVKKFYTRHIENIRQASVRIWRYASPRAWIAIFLGMDWKDRYSRYDGKGQWRIELAPLVLMPSLKTFYLEFVVSCPRHGGCCILCVRALDYIKLPICIQYHNKLFQGGEYHSVEWTSINIGN